MTLVFDFEGKYLLYNLTNSDLTDAELLGEIIKVLNAEGRQGRQAQENTGNFESCSLVGFEFRRGEECNEVKEIECYPVNVTKKR